MQTKILPANDPNSLLHARDVLSRGGLVAFPTDTVYGLAADAYNSESIERLYVVKGRNSSKAIAILLSDFSELPQVSTNPGAIAQRLAEKFWPGPLTLVIPRHPNLPEVLSPFPTVGVRVPDHPIALQLLRLTGPLAVTSANRSGGRNALTAEEVRQQLGGHIHLILDGGQTPGGVPSTVVDCTTVELSVLRPGPISREALQSAVRHLLSSNI